MSLTGPVGLLGGCAPKLTLDPLPDASYALKFSLSPGLGHRHLNSFPVDEHVTQASIMSAPPKQMLVVIRSGKAKCSVEPSGSKAVTPPLMMVATHTRPPASTARLSSSWKPGRLHTTRPGPKPTCGPSDPGSSTSNAQSRP